MAKPFCTAADVFAVTLAGQPAPAEAFRCHRQCLRPGHDVDRQITRLAEEFHEESRERDGKRRAVAGQAKRGGLTLIALLIGAAISTLRGMRPGVTLANERPGRSR